MQTEEIELKKLCHSLAWAIEGIYQEAETWTSSREKVIKLLKEKLCTTQ